MNHVYIKMKRKYGPRRFQCHADSSLPTWLLTERSINLFFRVVTVTVGAYAVRAAYPSNHWLIVLDVMRLG